MTFYYDEQIVPLLRRMSDLEDLTLFLPIRRQDSTFMDGNQLYNDVLSSMTRLQKFSFSIQTQLINQDIGMFLSTSRLLICSYSKVGSKMK